jgi:hypothetical protein
MKKALLTLSILSSIVTTYSQRKPYDRDTVYVYERRDTVACRYLYQSGKSNVKVAIGYAVLSGFFTDINGARQWQQAPSLVAVLDKKKRPAKNVIQLLQ